MLMNQCLNLRQVWDMFRNSKDLVQCWLCHLWANGLQISPSASSPVPDTLAELLKYSFKSDDTQFRALVGPWLLGPCQFPVALLGTSSAQPFRSCPTSSSPLTTPASFIPHTPCWHFSPVFEPAKRTLTFYSFCLVQSTSLCRLGQDSSPTSFRSVLIRPPPLNHL